MRQIWITKVGPPEVLEVKEAPDPEPKAGEVRIRVEASGVNFADIMGRLGLYPDLPPIPVVPGYEVSGHVDAVGAGVASNWAGSDVLAATRFGGYADAVCVPIKQVFARPPGMSALEAASIPVNYFTAWQLIVVMGGLKANETVLIHSAGGGVGIAATQIAKHIGARVIGTASAAKHAELRALGTDHLIDYRTEDFETRTREITNGRGVELILDAVGGESWKKGYRVLAPTGRLGRTITSPILTPTWKEMRLSSASLIVSSLMRVRNCKAARTASTALGNSAKKPSPVFFTMRPPCSAITGSIAPDRSAVKRACVASSSLCISRE
jgi:synaptic vesicle membrane protein VAT-1